LNGVFIGSMRRFQNGFISRYSMRFVPATMAAKNWRLMFIVRVSTSRSCASAEMVR
jgi:hypothetical protein